jgi:RIO kinase 2
MKLDARNIRHLSPTDWRILAAVRPRSASPPRLTPPVQVEQGSRNHHVVPTSLIASIASGPAGHAASSSLRTLSRLGLVARGGGGSAGGGGKAPQDGYRLTFGGLDYLALRALAQCGAVAGVGRRIGVGKEADVMLATAPVAPSDQTPGQDERERAPTERRDEEEEECVIKIHRLGRISFRRVKTQRDYHRGRPTAGAGTGWQQLSQLAAAREHAVLHALHASGFPVPRPRARSRHIVAMDLVARSVPLRAVDTGSVRDPAALHAELLRLVLRLAAVGLVHGDFNEFNVLIQERDADPSAPAGPADPPPPTLHPYVIDFPQTLSLSHPDAAAHFARDIACVADFFRRRFNFASDEPLPTFADARRARRRAEAAGVRALDAEVEAAGFDGRSAARLEAYWREARGAGDETRGLDGEADEEDDGDEVGDDSDGDDDEDLDDLLRHRQASGDDDVQITKVLDEASPDGVAGMLSEMDMNDTASLAPSARSSKSRNAAKAANGWAI